MEIWTCLSALVVTMVYCMIGLGKNPPQLVTQHVLPPPETRIWLGKFTPIPGLQSLTKSPSLQTPPQLDSLSHSEFYTETIALQP
jgi:hypothetical protein